MGLSKTYRIQKGDAICVIVRSGHQGIIYQFYCFKREEEQSRLRFMTVGGTDCKVGQGNLDSVQE